MNDFLFGVTRAVVETFTLPEPILEIGSYQVAGQERYDLRPLLGGRDYRGVDMRPGPGVDVVENVEALSLPSGSAGTVIALSVFEHVRRFWKGIDEVRRVLRPDGVLLLSMPFYFHIHAYPSDYWRFTPEALKLLLEEFPRKIVGVQGGAKRPAHVWAVAFGAGYGAIEPAIFERFEAALARHARQPLPVRDRLRYGLGRWLCGRRPFEPWLDADRCQCELVVTAA